MEKNKSILPASTRHINVERVYGGRIRGNIWEDILKLSAENGALNMALGFPDFAPPSHVVKALEQVTSYSDHMIHHYTRASGHIRFCAVLGRLYSRLLMRDINPMTDILTTTGAYDALFTTFQALICPGDEVILIEPCYEPYMELARLAGATVKYVPLIPKQNSTSSDDWVFDPEALQAAFNTKTKAIVVNTPMNPLGKVFNRDELQTIADLCVKHDTLCFADEVYQWLVYGNRKHIHIATLDGMAERTITIGSAGKTFSVTGWKTGWAVGPTNLMDALQAFHHLTIRGGSSVLQEAVAVALEKEEKLLGSKECYFYQLSNDMQNKRDQLVEYLREADLNPVMPGGGYFIVADISKLDSNINKDESVREAFDINFVKWAIVEKKFTVIPLSIFYSQEHQYLGEKYIRICFAKTDETLKKAKAVLTKWNESKPSDGVVIQNGF